MHFKMLQKFKNYLQRKVKESTITELKVEISARNLLFYILVYIINEFTFGLHY